MNDSEMFKEQLDDSDYEEFSLLRDSKGFSVQRDYPDNVAFKSAIDTKGNSDTVALVHFVLLAENQKDNLIPVLLSARKYSRYLSNHYDFDFNDPESPTESSVLRSKKTKQPIDLESVNDYFFNIENKKTYDSFGNEFTLKEVLDDILKEHFLTARPFRGTVIRSKFGLNKFFQKFVRILIRILKFYLKMVNGILFEPGDSFAGELSLYKRSNMRSVKTENFDFFGYKTSKNSILFLALLSTLLFFLNPDFPLKNRLVYGFKNYELLSVGLALVLLWIIDWVFPTISFYVINLLIWIKVKSVFLKFNLRLWPFYWLLKRINILKYKKIISQFIKTILSEL